MNVLRIASAATLAGSLFAGACSSSNPTAGAAVREFMGAYCQKLTDCFGTAGYATSVSDCVQNAVNMVANPNAQEACSQAQIDACTNDTKNLACGASLSSTSLPSSCSGC